MVVLKRKLALAEQKARLDREKDERDREWAREARERGWEIEKERMAMQNQTPPSTSTSRTASRAEIHHLLPRLTDDDVLTFFHTFERAMNLNRVEKEDWPRFLPAQLNSKANKVLSGLSLEENENYDICKPVSYTHLTLPTNREV